MKVINNNFSLLGTNCKFNAIPFKNNCVNCGAPRIEIGRFIMGTNNLCVRIMCVHIIKYRAFVFSGFSLPRKKQIYIQYQYKCNSCCDNYYSSNKNLMPYLAAKHWNQFRVFIPAFVANYFPLRKNSVALSAKDSLHNTPVSCIYPQERRQKSADHSRWHCDNHYSTNYVLWLLTQGSCFQIEHIVPDKIIIS